MANIKSAQKRIRQTKVRTERNKALKTRVRTEHRKFEAALEKGDQAEIATLYSQYTSAVDKAHKNNLFHRNKAANLKSKAAQAMQA